MRGWEKTFQNSLRHKEISSAMLKVVGSSSLFS